MLVFLLRSESSQGNVSYMALAHWSQRHQKCKAGQSAKRFGSPLRTVPIHHLLAMAAMRQDDRSSIHIRLQGTLFPNFSSQPEGDSAKQKVGNDFCVFEFQMFFCTWCKPAQTVVENTVRTSCACLESGDAAKNALGPQTNHVAFKTPCKPPRHPLVSRSSRKPRCPLSWPSCAGARP